jgi:outer membrane immunogenic protein
MHVGLSIMKRAILAAVGLVGLGPAAWAAGEAVQYRYEYAYPPQPHIMGVAPVAVQPQAPAVQGPSLFAPTSAYSWTGFYAGLQGGYGFGEDETRLNFAGAPLPLPVSTRFETDGFVGGAHAGFNTQFGMIVAGIEGDLEFSDVSGQLTLSQASIPVSASASTQFNWQGSIRARVGIALHRTLIYATGGLAYANIDNVYAVTLPAPNVLGIAGGTYSETGANKDHWGWTVGGGIEDNFWGNLTARIEYRYTQFERYENASRYLANGGSASQEPHVHAFRIGASYKY